MKATDPRIETIEQWEEIALVEKIALSYEGGDYFTNQDIAKRFCISAKSATYSLQGICKTESGKKYTFIYKKGSPRRGNTYTPTRLKIVSVNYLGSWGIKKDKVRARDDLWSVALGMKA